MRRSYADVGRAVVDAARADRITFLAASVAYYAFVSLLPALLLLFAVGTALGGAELADRLVASVGGALSPSGQDLLRGALTDATGRGEATVVGVALLLWSTLKLFRGLDIAFEEVYGVETAGSFLDGIRDALAALGGLAFGVGTLGAVGALAAVVDVPVFELLGALVLPLALLVAFLPLYVVLPDRRVPPREALPGAAFAAVGWTVLGIGFGVYAETAGAFRLYGVVGGVLLLVTWFYVGGLVVLLGATLNVVLAGDGDRQLQQAPRRPSERPSMTGAPDEGSRADDATDDAGDADDADDADEVAEVREELDRLRAELESFEDDVEDRTLHRDEVERDLRAYVRRRLRRGHARRWGPYLVLLYGTGMTLGAFYFLRGIWAILAMLVVWLSTLGLYTLMVLTGTAFSALGLPGRAVDWVRQRR